MGFSRYCPSSLDLTNFVVRRCRGGVAEVPRTVRRPAQVRPRPGPGLGLGIWKSGNLEIWKFGIQKWKKTLKSSKSKSVSPKLSARSGLIGNKSSWHYKNLSFFGFFRPTQKIAWDGPKWGWEVLFPANPDLADISGRTDFDFENSYFCFVWDPMKFPGFRSQISRIPDFQNSRFPGSQIFKFPDFQISRRRRQR